MSPQNIAAITIVIAINVIYFILMSKKFNLSLFILLGYSIAATVMLVTLTLRWFNAVCAFGSLISLLYDIGITVHLIRGKRRVLDVLDE